MKQYKKIHPYEIAFAVTALLVAIFMQIVYHPFTISDEGAHFYTSYYYADKIVGRKAEKTNIEYRDIKGVVLANYEVRECERFLFELNETDDLLKHEYEHSLISDKNDCFETSVYIYTYFPLPTYLIDAIIIICGQWLNLTGIALVYLLRFCNLLLYIIGGIIAMRMLPVGKELFFAIFLLPVSIENASSCSLQSLFFMFIWIYISAVLSVKCKKISKLTAIGLLLYSVLLAPIKGIGIGFVFLVLMLRDSFEKKESFIKYSVTVLVISCMIWLAYNIAIINAEDIIAASHQVRYVEYASANGVYISDIISHPIRYLIMTLRTLLEFGSYILPSMDTSKGVVGEFVKYMFLFIIAAATLRKSDDKLFFSGTDKTIMLLLYIGVYSLTGILGLISWSGSQTLLLPLKMTYMVPMMPLFWLSLRSKKIEYYLQTNDFIKKEIILIPTAYVIAIVRYFTWIA